MGFGAHRNARIGLSRAITEMNQFIPAVLSVDGAGNTQYLHQDPEPLEWWRTATPENQPYLSSTLPLRQAAEYGDPDVHDMTAELLSNFRQIEEAGME